MDDASPICGRYHEAVELIGARWNGAIVRALLEGRHRYSDIKAVIPAIGDTMLTQRLRALERAAVVERRVASTAPVRIEYHLTAKGAALAPVVEALTAWAHEWIPTPREGRGAPASPAVAS